MTTAEFIDSISGLLRDSGHGWIDDAVQRSIAQGAGVERKEVRTIGLSKGFKEQHDQTAAVLDSVNYSEAFEEKPGRAIATITRQFSTDEIEKLYLFAIYSVFIEPSEPRTIQ